MGINIGKADPWTVDFAGSQQATQDNTAIPAEDEDKGSPRRCGGDLLPKHVRVSRHTFLVSWAQPLANEVAVGWWRNVTMILRRQAFDDALFA
jgi:hypothetical protein